MPEWRVETESGSIYLLKEIGGEWRMTVPIPPCSPAGVGPLGAGPFLLRSQFRGLPRVGGGMVLLIE